ncbi:Hypothetical_protein [Hexamita inflata]|uniref:Hypothetical_protein n=1 Tax=Hexamita inflata TaxID=28002 RepID=A0AA86UR61_9EUKA|nr:Hypothetical protein HINF_LOCUS49187 [Hexamita inflata]
MNNLQQKQIDELNENKLILEEQIQILKHELFNGKINQGIESPQIMELNNEIIRYKQDLQTQMNYINTKQTINQIIAQIQQQNSEIVESNRIELNGHKTIIKNNQTQYVQLYKFMVLKKKQTKLILTNNKYRVNYNKNQYKYSKYQEMWLKNNKIKCYLDCELVLKTNITTIIGL